MKNERISAGRIFWGLLLLGVAVVLILEGIGVGDVYGVSIPGVGLGILLITWLVYLIAKKRYYMVFLPLGLFYTFVVDKPLAKALGVTKLSQDGRIVAWWIVLIASLLLCIAFKVLFTKKNVIDTGAKASESHRLGDSTVYFDAANLHNALITENVGKMNVYIANKEQYEGDGIITIRENVGVITLHIPANWAVVNEVHENLGSVSIPENDTPAEKTITVVVTENVGRIIVEFNG
ncbi:MAG: hypothetical protein II777_05715 [Clostridia bacterium]|nr:hypothetical protein [Clostridia bacterium]